MNYELLLLIKNHTDTLIEQTKTKQQETLESRMNKQMQTFSFNPPINLLEEGKWLLAFSSLSVQILFLTSLTRTIGFQSLYQVIGRPNLMKKLLTN